MFQPCPHCQFLVARPPQPHALPATCPRCGLPLQDQGGADAAAEADAPAVAIGAVDAPAADPPPAGAAPARADAAAAPAASRSGRRPGRWQWPLLALLAVLLPVQILLADRARLAADPRWRPLLASLCAVSGCGLPPWHEPDAFTMLDRQVRPGPGPGALRVDASFRNDARWAQAWPALQLALSDADGRVLGRRVFQPAEYLGAAPDSLLAPGQSAQVGFTVQEPGPGTVAFSFEFR